MKKPIKVFEPLTKEQIKKLHSMARRIGLSSTDLYTMVADLIGVPSITSLSKQESIFLIDHLQEKPNTDTPPSHDMKMKSKVTPPAYRVFTISGISG